MLKFIDNYFQHKDNRGSITGIINFGNWEEINFIKSENNIVRGNHYHKQTTELFIILKGKIKVRIQSAIQTKDEDILIEEFQVQGGDVFLIEPNCLHTFEVLEYSEWLNVLSKKIDSLCPDLFRL